MAKQKIGRRQAEGRVLKSNNIKTRVIAIELSTRSRMICSTSRPT